MGQYLNILSNQEMLGDAPMVKENHHENPQEEMARGVDTQAGAHRMETILMMMTMSTKTKLTTKER